jgi:hypothetical protein|tara:strand:+ start:506 stop:727 length:222 start_codon:yes stop_codon:yes gene_type:complete
MENLMLYTAQDLKNIISDQLPSQRNFKKKRKELLIEIIKENELDTSNLKPIEKKEKQPDKINKINGEFILDFT